jgi:hypothetical protein
LNLQLTQEEGDLLKDLIQSNTFYPFPRYCETVGMKASNVYAILSGQRVVSLDLLNKILSGVNNRVVCKVQIHIQELETGRPAQTVDSTTIEEELLFGTTHPEENPVTYSLSEKLPEEQKTLPESPSQENPTESSTDPTVTYHLLQSLLNDNLAGLQQILSAADQKTDNPS